MTKLQLIREKCIEANPEIVELKEGAVIFVNENFGIKGYGNSQCVSHYTPELEEVGLFGYNEIGKKRNITEIIGRPIRLADVLLAIDKNKKWERWSIWGGERRTDNVYFKGVVHWWELKDDNLDHQSKETIDFIHGLLK